MAVVELSAELPYPAYLTNLMERLFDSKPAITDCYHKY